MTFYKEEDGKLADKVISSSIELDKLMVEYIRLLESKFSDGS